MSQGRGEGSGGGVGLEDAEPAGAPVEGASGRGWPRVEAWLSRLHLAGAFEAERARWVLWSPVVFGSGIALYFKAAHEPHLWTAWAWPLMAAGLIAATRSDRARLAGLALLLAGLGFAAAKTRTEHVRAPSLERPLSRADVTGSVTLVEPRPGGGVRISLRDLEISGLAVEKTPRLVRIRVLRPKDEIRPGDRVRLTARLSPPQGPALPGGYDFARIAYFAGLGATGFAFKAPIRVPRVEDKHQGALDQALDGVREGLQDLRQEISERIMAAIPGELGGLATALITGERGGISEETTDAFRNSGLLHILSISGLHMVVMAGAVYAAMRAALAAIPTLAMRFPIRRWAAAAASIAAFGYLLISGASIATVRAYLMIAIMFLAVMMDRPALAMRNVALSAILILLLMPESLLDPGFQMSFACVVALVSAYEAARNRSRVRADDDAGPLSPLMQSLSTLTRHLRDIVISTLIASAAVAPFAIYHFHKSQQFALIANLIAIPITNLIVMPAGLLTLIALPLGLEAVPLAVMSWGLEAMHRTATLVSSLPGAVVRVEAIPDLAFALMIAGGLWLTLWETRWRMLGIAGIAAGIVYAPWHDRPALLAGEGGRMIAVRGVTGALDILADRSDDFALTQWLEHDGDERDAKEARARTAFDCDRAGCTLRAPGLGLVAVTRHESALGDDCAKADVLITRVPMTQSCPRPRLIIDGRSLYRSGPAAVFLKSEEDAAGTSQRLTLMTSEEVRGERPWTRQREQRADRTWPTQGTARPKRSEQRSEQRSEPGPDPKPEARRATQPRDTSDGEPPSLGEASDPDQNLDLEP